MPTLKLGEFNLHYEITGEGDPILFIHGLGSAARDWLFQTTYFSKHYQCITADVRGHGESGKPPGPYSIPLFTQDLIALLEFLHTPPVHVVGLSMGGMIAFQIAVDRPDLVRSLCIVNSSPMFVIRNFKERLQVWERFLFTHLLGMRRTGKILGKRLFPKPEQAGLRKIFTEFWAANDKRAYEESMKALVGWSVADRLGEIRSPTLIVSAEHDYLPFELKKICIQRMPNARLAVIEDARHGVTVEKPAEFNAVLEEFLCAL
jgi:3-oxoadipate enol-lactonase